MKKILAFVLSLSLAASVFAPTVSAAEPEITLKLGSTTSEGTAEIEACHYFADRLEELSGGTMTCDVLANGLAGTETEIIEGEQMGSMDMSVICGVLQNFDSALMFLEWDFLFVNEEHLKEVLYGEIGDQIEQRILDTTGVRVLSTFMRTPRLMSTTKKIETLEDLKGLKIRVPEMAARTALWRALGTSPTPMSFNEVYSALQTNVIEGQENPINTIVANKLYEVCPYLTISNHVYGFMYLNISDITWQKLNEEQRAWVQQAADEAAEYNDKLAVEMEKEQLDEAAEFMEVTEVDTTEWRERTKDVYKEFESDPNYDAFEKIYLQIVEAGEKY
ncbi:MAG: TRAP transporter substrate-binding protein [Lachnospiraceae bacterium]|nr:TRAP transporter substrate-binding protein [Lachnospiraceae bacterium]